MNEYQSNGVEVFVEGGIVRGRVAGTANVLLPTDLTNLLLLDIAQTLMEIKCWGIAADSEIGQPVYER